MKIKTMYAIIASTENSLDIRISSVVSSEKIAQMNVKELNQTDKYGDTFEYEEVTVFDYEEETT